MDLTTLDEMDFTDKEAAKLSLLPGDLLVCEGGDIGRTAMWYGEIEGCGYQNHVHRLRTPRLDVEPFFYMYWMQAALRLLGLYEGAGNKTTIPNLSKTRLGSFSVPLPPLPEQRAIAHILGTVQKAIEATEQVIVATQELRRSLMNHLFTYGPVPVDEAEQVPLKETEVGAIPDHWTVVGLGDVAKSRFKNGIFVKGPRWGTGTRYLNVADVYPNSVLDTRTLRLLEVAPEHQAGFEVKEGDVVFVRSSLKREGVARACLVPATQEKVIFDCHLIKVVPEQTVIHPRYLVEYCRWRPGHSRLIALSKTTTMTTIPQGNLAQFQLPLPPLKEQEEAAKILIAIDQKAAAEQIRKGSLEILFKTLLHNLMTGKVRVNDLDLSAVEELV